MLQHSLGKGSSTWVDRTTCSKHKQRRSAEAPMRAVTLRESKVPTNSFVFLISLKSYSKLWAVLDLQINLSIQIRNF